MALPCPTLLFTFTIFSYFFAVRGIVCRKEKVSPLGLNYGAMNVECGQYVQHCLKAFHSVLMWDGTIIRDCDPLAFCPHDGSKVIKNADYFCCAGNLCNGKVDGKGRNIGQTIVLLTITIGQIYYNLIKEI